MQNPLSEDKYKAAINALSPEEREEFYLALAAMPIWRPQKGPQEMALSSSADIVGYGGSAGGGKTDLAIGAALTCHKKSIIFRPEYPQLADIERRAKEVTEGYRSGFNGQAHILTMPDGVTLEFGACSDEDQARKFRGRPHDYKVFDEVTEFQEKVVRFITAWKRTTVKGQKTQSLLTFNPPQDTAGEWVVAFFAPWLDPTHPNPAEPGEIRWFAQMLDEHGERREVEVSGPGPFDEAEKDTGRTERIYAQSRTFIPARLSDNAYLDADGEYRRNLQSLPEPLRSQLLYGDMNAAKVENPWQVIPTKWVLAAMARSHKVPKPDIKLTALGVDVAHGGDDKTVIAKRYGVWFDKLKKYPGRETPDGKSAAALVVMEYEHGAIVNVDAIGYGASCAEKLIDSPDDGGYGISNAHAINVATSDTKSSKRYTDKSKKYFMKNRRAEMHWRLREILDPENGHEAVLPDDRELLADLCAPKYEITPSGIAVLSKDEIKADIGRSPDCGESVLLSTLPEETPDRVAYLPRYGAGVPKRH